MMGVTRVLAFQIISTVTKVQTIASGKSVRESKRLCNSMAGVAGGS